MNDDEAFAVIFGELGELEELRLGREPVDRARALDGVDLPSGFTNGSGSAFEGDSTTLGVPEFDIVEVAIGRTDALVENEVVRFGLNIGTVLPTR